MSGRSLPVLRLVREDSDCPGRCCCCYIIIRMQFIISMLRATTATSSKAFGVRLHRGRVLVVISVRWARGYIRLSIVWVWSGCCCLLCCKGSASFCVRSMLFIVSCWPCFTYRVQAFTAAYRCVCEKKEAKKRRENEEVLCRIFDSVN